MNLLFGSDHRKKTETQFFNMAGKERAPSLNPDDLNALIDVKEKKEDSKLNDKIRFRDNRIESLRKYFFPSLKGDVLYLMSIIDFFQLYNLHKKLETKYKQFAKGVDAKCISSVPPEDYKDRFIEFIKQKTDCEKYLKEIYDSTNKNDF